ncbi:response regulator [Undibacterium sp. Di26W]|uniref:response regulator n=1 Tax=Undibacterium sp. Di26W TaxID=3413035 RepID=UPI003BF36D2D
MGKSPKASALWPMAARPISWYIFGMHILIIDDHALFREGLALLLHGLLPDVETTEAGSCEQAFEQLRQGEDVDLVLLDIGLPGMNGFDGLSRIRQEFPDFPVVVLSSNEDRESVMRALDGGAMGFVPKSASSGVLAGALQLILAKGIYLPASVFLAERHGSAVPVSVSAPGVSFAQLGLTPRQIDVLHLVLQGKSSKLICRDLGLSLGTVKTHTSAALRALNVTTRTQAVIAAAKLGLSFAPQPVR